MGNNLVDRCDFEAGQWIDNAYCVVRILGEGSFGKVYHVRDKDGNEYALKLLRLWEVSPDIRPDLIRRFEVEFRTGQIDCPYLVHSFRFQFLKGNPYILMEYCPGGDLSKFLGRADDRTVRICWQILTALRELHVRGKVHRDLKPENILFRADGSAALTDFGVVGDQKHRMTDRNWLGKPTQMFGTYAYMPPEQANRKRGGVTVLPTTDIFSFGVLLYQMLTGAYPFGPLDSHNELAEYQRRMKEGEWKVQPLKCLPDARMWYKILSRCLATDYRERFQSVDQIMELLPKVDGGMAVSASRAGGRLDDGRMAGDTKLSLGRSDGAGLQKGQYLRLLNGESDQLFFLTDYLADNRKLIRIGRDGENDLVLDGFNAMYVSRWHCTLECCGNDCWLIRDGQWLSDQRRWELSSNGTFVNTSEVDAMGCFLHEGDILTLGDTKLRFENHPLL